MSKSSTIPPIGITMGCPAGIGPEIIIKYFQEPSTASVSAVVIGDIGVLEKTAASLAIFSPLCSWKPGENLKKDHVNVMKCSSLSDDQTRPGQPTPASGKAMATYVDVAISLCLEGHIGGIATCPISKTALNNAGYNFPGHTELLADRTGSNQVAMMMAGNQLRVTLATIHCSLAEIPSLLSKEKIVDLITLTNASLHEDFNLLNPRIAVAGLNPHGGEDCLFGSEEKEIIAPAVRIAADSGIDVKGPYPPDTVFNKAVSGSFDAVICMYHDQGLIPFKLLHFSDGVNVTLGLPIVRTSVDHGTAYDIAGKGIADCRSLTAAVAMASMISSNRRNSLR